MYALFMFEFDIECKIFCKVSVIKEIYSRLQPFRPSNQDAGDFFFSILAQFWFSA